jgi:hypothetical protein
MKRLVITTTVLALAAGVLVQAQGQPQQQEERVRQIPAGRPGPVETDPKVINLPVPRMHDGRPDLTGPGSGADRTRTSSARAGSSLASCLFCRGRATCGQSGKRRPMRSPISIACR